MKSIYMLSQDKLLNKNVIFLINSAAYSREYFVELSKAMEAYNIKALFVLDSHLSDVMSGENGPLPNAKYFTDYCRAKLAEPAGETLVAPPEWRILFSDFDRFLTFGITPPLNKNDAMDYGRVIQLLGGFFDEIFEQFEPHAVIYEQVSNSFAMAAFRSAQQRNIPFFSLAPARIGGHVEISATGAMRDHVTVGKIWAAIRQAALPQESRDVAEAYISSIDHQVPDYMRPGGDGAALIRTSLVEKYLTGEMAQRFLRALRYRMNYRDDAALAYQFGDPLVAAWALFRRAVKRRLRMRRVLRLFQDRVEADRYFLYPLHFHPEASTSILASDFVDELSVIKAIAFRLPSDVKLVVKEHPSATALQPLSFYRELDALPNVELLAPNTDAKQMARKSIGVICLTSTLGFEAAAMNKPVICLGDVLFGYFPNVRMIEHYGDLDQALNWAFNYTPLDPEQILSAMTAYVEYIDAGSFSFRGSLRNSAAIDHMAKILASKIDSQT
jgi:Capsule polysaccharide biosynthesis protein